MKNWTLKQWEEYGRRVEAVMEELGCDRSDAEGIVDAQLKQNRETIEGLSRSQLIDALLESDRTFRFDDQFGEWFESLLLDGFKGYRHRSDEDLREQLSERVARNEFLLN
jgi:hypothetical protein